MNKSEYHLIAEFIYQSCGIALGEEKQYLMEQRLIPVAKEFGGKSLVELASLIQSKGQDSVLKEKVIGAITTNETSFFRDQSPFVSFQNFLLPELTDLAVKRRERLAMRRGNKISIWSAASSTGQEAYTLAMLIHEYLGSGRSGIQPRDFSILGTDISTEVLSQAIAGEYSVHELSRGIGPERKVKHFEQVGEKWVAKPHLRELVQFKQLNLMENFTFLGGFDVVFIRNVLIYF